MRSAEILLEGVTKRPWVFYHGTQSAPFDKFEPIAAIKGEQFWNPLGNAMYASNEKRFAGNFGGNVYEVHIPPGSTYKRINANTWSYGTGQGLVKRALKRALKACGQNIAEYDGTVQTPMPDFKKLSDDDIRKIYRNLRPELETNTEAQERIKAATRDVLISNIKSIWHYSVDHPRNREKEKIWNRFRSELGLLIRKNSPYEGLYESLHLIDQKFGPDVAEKYAQFLPEESDKKFSKFDFIVFTETNDVIGTWDDKKQEAVSAYEVLIFNPALQKTVKRG